MVIPKQIRYEIHELRELLELSSNEEPCPEFYKIYIIWIKGSNYPLYIGTSKRIIQRLKQHFGIQDWLSKWRCYSPLTELVKRTDKDKFYITVYRPFDKKEVYQAERDFAKLFKPWYLPYRGEHYGVQIKSDERIPGFLRT